MEKITRNVRDLENDERRAYESLVGHCLRENQQIILQVITLGEPPEEEPAQAAAAGPLPYWCNVYEGLSDDEIAEVEGLILHRADFSRPS